MGLGKMITCDMQGGLGNVMFQVATAYALAKRNNGECYFDLSQDIKCITPHFNNLSQYKPNVFHKLPDCKITNHINHYSEPYFHFNPIPYSDDLFIHGYFQSHLYFDDMRDKIQSLFELPEDIKIELDSKYSWDFSKCISFHIRRGDYVKLQNVHRLLDYKSYLQNCKKFLPNKTILIFSDDIEWAEKTFNEQNIVVKKESDTDWADMYYMSCCEHNIIANSTFSWWSAYLNNNPNKKVLYPSKWFAENSPHNIKDLYPQDWQVISL